MSIVINALADLCSVSQDLGGKDIDGQAVVQTAFAAVDEAENAFFGFKLGISMRQLTLDIVRECLRPLPDEEIYPVFPDEGGLTAAPDDVSNYYVKRTAWPTYLDFQGTDFLPKLMLQEAQTMEFLAQHRHPHIVDYYGCRVKRGRITGLVLEDVTFQHDLDFAVTRPDLFKYILDKDRVMAGILSAVKHLHALGLAHNDLKPANIMLGKDGEPKLIDFGSCQPFGQRLMSCGTPGWCQAHFSMSDKAHDEYGLKLLEPWLDDIMRTVEESVCSTADWRVELQDVPPFS
jgi:hypothetical protein